MDRVTKAMKIGVWNEAPLKIIRFIFKRFRLHEIIKCFWPAYKKCEMKVVH